MLKFAENDEETHFEDIMEVTIDALYAKALTTNADDAEEAYAEGRKAGLITALNAFYNGADTTYDDDNDLLNEILVAHIVNIGEYLFADNLSKLFKEFKDQSEYTGAGAG